MSTIARSVEVKDPSLVPEHLRTLAARASAIAIAAFSQHPRTNKSVALGNLCNYVGSELTSMSVSFPHGTGAMAWHCRNLFEASLIIRAVISDETYLQKWLGQRLRDEADFIEGVLSQTAGSQQQSSVAVLEAHLRRLADISSRHGVEPAKPFNVADLAKTLGLSDEYAVMFKLCSKYVHPSSLLINAWQKSPPPAEWTNVFLVMGQIYAGDAVGRVEQLLAQP